MEICKLSISFLGVILYKGTIELQPHILIKLQEFPDELRDKTQLQAFLGCVNYANSFVMGLAKCRYILNQRLTTTPGQWTPQHTNAVRTIKQLCSQLPPLQLPTNGQLIIFADASEHSWGAVLAEQLKDNLRICRYSSGTFNPTQINYHSSHKEILAAKKALEHFYLFVQSHHIILRSDLNNFSSFLSSPNSEKVANKRLLRWSLFFENFDISYEHIPGIKNVLADMLSRLAPPLDDNLPTISVITTPSTSRANSLRPKRTITPPYITRTLPSLPPIQPLGFEITPLAYEITQSPPHSIDGTTYDPYHSQISRLGTSWETTTIPSRSDTTTGWTPPTSPPTQHPTEEEITDSWSTYILTLERNRLHRWRTLDDSPRPPPQNPRTPFDIHLPSPFTPTSPTTTDPLLVPFSPGPLDLPFYQPSNRSDHFKQEAAEWLEHPNI